MADVVSEDRFAVNDEKSKMVALAMLRRRLLELGVTEPLVSKLMTIASELGVNIVKYASRGNLFLKQIQLGRRRGLEISAIDEGPGIADVDQALKDHFSTQGTLGLGLPGVKRMVDDFRLESEVGEGTRVFAIVWL